MKVTKEVWNERMQNLNDRRAVETIKNSVQGVDNYQGHLNKIKIGQTVLDIGCGSMIIKDCLLENTNYFGIDAFPIKEGTIKMEAEDLSFFKDDFFDTVFVFAMLDNVHDFKLAVSEMKRVCNGSILFLTGVDIIPDKYHTILITEEMLTEEMKPFKVGYREKLHEKILLIEFKK